MLRFSASVGRRASPPRRVQGPTTSQSPNLCAQNLYQPWQDPIHFGDEDDDDEVVTQEEQLTLSPSDPTGFTQHTQLTQHRSIARQNRSTRHRVSDASKTPDVPINLDDQHNNNSGSEQEITNARESVSENNDAQESEQDGTSHSSEVANSTTTRIRPQKLSCMPRFTLSQKRMTMQEAYAEPKRIRSTARKYKLCHGTIHHWKHLFDNAVFQEDTNINITSSHASYIRQAPVGYESVEQFASEQGTVWAKSSINRLTFHNGCKPYISDWASQHLTDFFESLCERSHPVAVYDLCHEYMTICPVKTETLS